MTVVALLRNSLRAALFAMSLVVAAGVFAPAMAVAGTGHEFESSFGPDGTEATHFENPGAVAVDQESHDVYVADIEAGILGKFDENLAQLGIGAFA